MNVVNGIININKPLGITSHDVVSIVRKYAGTKKVGHTGTLDPEAGGVLPICIGKATRVADMITAGDKKYLALMKLGIKTDTQDGTGQILESKEVNISKEIIRNTVKSFIGKIEQIPPMYSAIRVNGQKLYELARKGIEVERKPRLITVFSINIKDINIEDSTVLMEVHCSKGTYIRTLCNDIGEKLGCGAHMASLTRSASGIFKIEDAVDIEKLKNYSLENKLDELVIPVDRIFSELPIVVVNDEGERKLINGNEVSIRFIHGMKENKLILSELISNIDEHKEYKENIENIKGKRDNKDNKDIKDIKDIKDEVKDEVKDKMKDENGNYKFRIYNKKGLFLSISELLKKETGELVFKLIKGFY